MSESLYRCKWFSNRLQYSCTYDYKNNSRHTVKLFTETDKNILKTSFKREFKRFKSTEIILY